MNFKLVKAEGGVVKWTYEKACFFQVFPGSSPGRCRRKPCVCVCHEGQRKACIRTEKAGGGLATSVGRNKASILGGKMALPCISLKAVINYLVFNKKHTSFKDVT